MTKITAATSRPGPIPCRSFPLFSSRRKADALSMGSASFASQAARENFKIGSDDQRTQVFSPSSRGKRSVIPEGTRGPKTNLFYSWWVRQFEVQSSPGIATCGSPFDGPWVRLGSIFRSLSRHWQTHANALPRICSLSPHPKRRERHGSSELRTPIRSRPAQRPLRFFMVFWSSDALREIQVEEIGYLPIKQKKTPAPVEKKNMGVPAAKWVQVFPCGEGGLNIL